MTSYALYLALVAVYACGLYAVWRRPGARMVYAGLVLAGGLLAALLATGSEPTRLLNDFRKAYYPAGVTIRSDADQLYDLARPELGGVAGFVNIPIVAWLFAPFTVFPEGQAGAVMTVLGVAVVIITFIWLVRFLSLRGIQVWLLAGLFVMNGPLFYSLREGNSTHFLLPLLLGIIVLSERRKDVGVGVLIGLAAVMKPPLLLLAGPFLLRRRFGVLAATLATGAFIGGLSLLLYGFDLHETWYRTAVEPYSRAPLGAFNVQSLDAFLTRLVRGDAHHWDWEPVDDLGEWFTVGRMLIAVTIVAAVGYICWRTRRESGALLVRQDLSVALLLALLVAPTTWSHYYCLLLVPMALAIGGQLGMPDDRRWWAVFGIGVLLVSAPVRAVTTDALVLGPVVQRLLLSHFFLGGVVFLCLLLGLRWRARTAAPGPVVRPARQPSMGRTAVPGSGLNSARLAKQP